MITLGDNVIGSDLPLGGRVRNLDVRQTGPIQAAVSWDLEGQGKSYVYLNGYLAQQPAESVASLSGLTEGSHNVSVITLPEHVRHPGFFYDELDGQRVRLRWPQAGATVAKYKVYGKHDGGSWELLEEVSEHLVEEMALAYPHSGTGTGKISVPSIGVDGNVNLIVIIEVTGANEVTYTYGAESGITTLNPGFVSYLPHGVQVHWEDPLEEYQIGDMWQIRVGVATEVLTSELEPGTWDFGVTAVSSEGWESSMLELPGQVFIPDFPQAVGDVTVAYDEDSEEFSIGFDMPTGAASVALYSNFDVTTGSYEPYVQEDVPLATLTGSDVLSLPEGQLKYYLWPVSASGAMLRDFTLRVTDLPLSLEQQGIVLGVPAELTADLVAAASPSYRLRWTYMLREGDSLHHFKVMRYAPNGTEEWEVIGTVSWDEAEGTTILSYDVVIGDTITFGEGPVDLKIVSCDSGEVHSVESEVVALEFVLTPPTFTGELEGGVA